VIGVAGVDLRDAVRRAPLSLAGVERLDAAVLESAREHWRVHMAAEFASARVFAGLVPQLMAAGADFADVRAATEMAQEEVEHGLMSARVYAALGGDPRSLLPPLEPVPDHADARSPLEVVLRNVIAISCCGETLAVSVLGGERERATLEPLRAVLTRILSDEVGHSRFGWRLLGEVAGALDLETKRRLTAYLVVLFERDLRVMIRAREHPRADWAALELGAADGELSWATYRETMLEITVPGLDRVGLQASWAFAKAEQRVLARA
jgi:hypothetical protein